MALESMHLKLLVLTLMALMVIPIYGPAECKPLPAHIRQNIHYHQGLRAYKRRDFKTAIYFFKKAIKSKQVPSLSHLGIGKSLYRLDKFDQAKKEIDRALELNPKCSDAYKWRGKAQLRDGKYKAAIDSFTKCAQYTTRKQTPLKARAGCHSALGRDDLALKDLTEALKYDQDPGIYIKRAQARVNLKQYQEAIADFRKGQKGTYNVDAVYLRVAYCYEKLGQNQNAINEYNKLLKINPLDDEARGGRARLYLKEKDYKKALADCSSAIDNYPLGTPRHLHKLRGDIYKAMGKDKKAALDYKKAAKN